MKHLKKKKKKLFWLLEITAHESPKSSTPKYYNIYIWVSLNNHPYCINAGYLLFFETTIMGKTDELAVVQKTIIDTLHKEGKSQRVITERGGCSQSAVSKHIKCKVDCKEAEKAHIQQGVFHMQYCQSKPIQTLGRASQGVDWSWNQCIKSHHAQTSSGKWLPWHFWNRNNVRSILKRTGLLLLFSDKSKFCIKFGNQVLETGEAHNPSSLKSSVKFSKSVMIWGAVTSAGVGPLCFLKSKVNAVIYQEILEHVMLPSADKLYGDADLIFQQDFSTCPHCQNCWPWYYCAWLASQHAWPEPHMESMEYFQEQDEKQWIQ